MIKQFFFGSSDSPLFMFHHALEAILILIFSFLFIAAIISWISSKRKKKIPLSTKKIISENNVIDSSAIIIQEEKTSVTAHRFKDSENYYDAFNTALQFDQTDSVQVYHKSRLVPGVEIMPYRSIFGFLEKLTLNLGGTSGSLGIQKERTVFASANGTKVAPAICYESIYGGFMSGYMRNGAQLIFVITNDGWWGNTPGYRQHMNYGRLLAIEFRKSIARSANTGISCFINQRGDVIQHTGWWEEDAIRQTLYKNDIRTFYAKHGDYPGMISSYASLLLLIMLPVKRVLRKRRS